MPVVRDLFDERAAAQREARDTQLAQDELRAQTDELHHQLRLAADEVGRKATAIDLGVDLSTVSNWLSCENGRGFPPPKLVLYLGRRSERLARWITVTGWGYLPPERPQVMTPEERLRRLEEALAANPDVQTAVYVRAFGSKP